MLVYLFTRKVSDFEMLVVNRAGYNFGFKHNGVQYIIPYDHKPHEIPNDSPRFRELQPLIIVESNRHKPQSNVVTVDKEFFANIDSSDFKDVKNLNEMQDIEDFDNVEDLDNELNEDDEKDNRLMEKSIPKRRVFSKFNAIKKKKKS